MDINLRLCFVKNVFKRISASNFHLARSNTVGDNCALQGKCLLVDTLSETYFYFHYYNMYRALTVRLTLITNKMLERSGGN